METIVNAVTDPMITTKKPATVKTVSDQAITLDTGSEVVTTHMVSFWPDVPGQTLQVGDNVIVIYNERGTPIGFKPGKPITGKMLEILGDFEHRLPSLLEKRDRWNGLYIDYEPPTVERLWMQDGDYRYYIHRIHPCGDALFHPHGWPSAIKVVSGLQKMEVGFGPGQDPPSVAMTLMMHRGTTYEMVNPNGWHSVRPIGGPTLSLMVTGKPWDRWSPKSKHRLPDLDNTKRELLFRDFQAIYHSYDQGK